MTTTKRSGIDKAWHLVEQGYVLFNAQAAITTGIRETGVATLAGSSGGLAAFRFDPADYPSTAVLRIKLIADINNVTPVANFTAHLVPLTAPAGAASSLGYTVGTIVTNSSAVVTAPTANTENDAVSASFTPPAAGRYALEVIVSANMAASSTAAVRAALEAQY